MSAGTGYMYNNSALYVTGAMALSQSAYLSWGGGLNDTTSVGFTQNANGTLMFKDHTTGSWTELGNSRDLTQVRNSHLVLTDDDVAHGITNVAQTEAYGDFGPIHSTRGGLMINGLSDQESADARSLALRGISNDTHTDTVATVEIIGAKRSGTSIQALASAETVLEVANHTTTLMTVLGDGKVGLGVVDPDSLLEVFGTSTQLKLSNNASDYASFAVGTNGDLTVTTVDAAAAAASLTFTIDGAIKLDGAGVEIENDSATGAAALLIDNDDTDQIALDIDAANIDADVIDISADAVTTAKVIDITADALTTGNIIYVDDDSSNTGTRNTVEVIQNHASAIAATALKVQSDGGITGVELDKNFAGTANATVTGLNIVLEKTAATTSDNTIYGVNVDLDNTSATNGTNVMVGIQATPTLTHAADEGTTTVKGAIVTATGGTNGTAVATGMELTTTGADTNNGLIINCADGGTDLKLLSSADTGDYFSIVTTTHGATTIATIDDNATAADLTFDVDGDIILDPAGADVLPPSDNSVNLGSASKRWDHIHTADITTGDLHMKNDRGDWTIVEEEDYLCVVNNKTNKRYKMMLEEIQN